MTATDLLIEIGCEEIPARMLPGAASSLSRVIVSLLDKAKLGHGEPRLYWSPRRLAVLVPGTQLATPPREETLMGPPARAAWDKEGNPTRAAEGFARKQGLVATELKAVETDRGVYAAAVIMRESLSLGDLLAPGFEKAVRGISFPKTMRWGEGVGSFVRPVQWLLALAGDEVLPLSLFGVRAGRETWAHRTLSPEPVSIRDAASWETQLAEAFVVADPEKRRERLHAALRAAATGQDAVLNEDEGLLAESADMVEIPAAIAGSFEQQFVDELPEEVLKTCLKHHQKAFSVHREGSVLPSFAVAVNMPTDPEGHIRRGHEWVNSGRLADALFFWREDRKRPLAARAGQLEDVVYQRALGNYAAKSRRVSRLARQLGASMGLGEEQLEALVQSAGLARADLVTGLVGEFPELQGVAGALLGRADGLPEAVTAAIYDLYRPASVEDALPETSLGRILGVADRLDTLVGGIAVGLMPSGSKDPFALRRAGLAAVRLAASCGLDLRASLAGALEGYSGGDLGPDLRETAGKTLPALDEFLLERFAALAEREGARYDEIKAVRAVARERFEPGDLFERLLALRSFRESDDFLALASAAKRVRNILTQAEGRGDATDPGQRAELLGAEVEQELAAKLREAGQNVAAARERGDYGPALGLLAGLRTTIDRFFDEVLVMDRDESLRLARLGLLASFDELAHEIVDLSELVVEGQ